MRVQRKCYISYRVFPVQAYRTSQHMVPRGGIFLGKWRSSFAGESDDKMNVHSACTLNTLYYTRYRENTLTGECQIVVLSIMLTADYERWEHFPECNKTLAVHVLKQCTDGRSYPRNRWQAACVHYHMSCSSYKCISFLCSFHFTSAVVEFRSFSVCAIFCNIRQTYKTCILSNGFCVSLPNTLRLQQMVYLLINCV
jgi:hypothetical protein